MKGAGTARLTARPRFLNLRHFHEPVERWWKKASSPRPSPPGEEREEMVCEAVRDQRSPSPREARAGRGLGRGVSFGFMVPMHAKNRKEALHELGRRARPLRSAPRGARDGLPDFGRSRSLRACNSFASCPGAHGSPPMMAAALCITCSKGLGNQTLNNSSVPSSKPMAGTP